VIFYPCEPRGGAWSKHSPFYRCFCVWLYRDFVSQHIFGWQYAFSILTAIFPEEKQPDEATIIGWYKDNPGYPEKLPIVGPPKPVEYFQEWCASHPSEARKFRALAFLKTSTESQSGGFRPQEYPGQPGRTAAPIYFPQVQSAIFNNNPIEQSFGVMCQLMFLAMAGLFARQCAEIAKS
jgi:hypothetical protein